MKQSNRKRMVAVSVILLLLIIGVLCGVLLHQGNTTKNSEETELEEVLFADEERADAAAGFSGTTRETSEKLTQQTQQNTTQEAERKTDELAQEHAHQEGFESVAGQEDSLPEETGASEATWSVTEHAGQITGSTVTEMVSQHPQSTTTTADEKNPNEMTEIPLLITE